MQISSVKTALNNSVTQWCLNAVTINEFIGNWLILLFTFNSKWSLRYLVASKELYNLFILNLKFLSWIFKYICDFEFTYTTDKEHQASSKRLMQFLKLSLSAI